MKTIAHDLSKLLDEVAALYQKYVTFTDERHPLVCALWCAQTWLFRPQSMHDIESTGYLAFVSPVKNCGKSNALHVTSALSYGHPGLNVSPTPATLFRAIGNTRGTVIFDELDNSETLGDLVSILNAGYKRGARVKRMGGKDREIVMEFETFCPKALGYIRDHKVIKAVKQTLESRCIRILLKKRTAKEERDAFRLTTRSLRRDSDDLVARLVRWELELGSLEETFLQMEEEVRPAKFRFQLDGRELEVWENLLAIAYLAGRFDDARSACIAVVKANREEDEDHASDTPILIDIQNNLDVMCDEEGLSTELAVRFLNQMEDRPYRKWSEGFGLTVHALGRILSKYGARPRPVGNKRLKRVPRLLILDMLERHLPAPEGN